jgi:nitrite reductase (cytochrome c-552)
MNALSRHLTRLVCVFALVMLSAGLVLWPASPLTAQGTKKDEAPAFNDDIDDPAAWGKVFPLHYELYLKTVDMTRTKHGGSEAMPHTPTQADPRSIVSRSKVEEDAGLKAIWQGYAFAADFREERGHAYMLEDQKLTQRQVVVKQPGACVNCHASMYLAYKKAGDGDIMKGFGKINAMPYQEAEKLVRHPVACIDCHDGNTLALRVTRPGFMEGMRAFKASQGVNDYDVNRDATPNEMRAYVCGQCHVEYYFKGPEKRLVYPWAKGLKVEQITAYYDEIGFRDWTHKDTGAPTLKAQHPEFEMWNQGVHGRSGVTCADCHMPTITYKDQQLTDHWVRSPVLNLKAACVSCHSKHDAKITEAQLKDRVEDIQDRHWALRNKAMAAVVGLIDDIKAAKASGRSDEDLYPARYLQRRSQFYLDFVEAENSTGFHAPQEGARILGESIDLARQGQLALRDKSFKPTVPVVKIPPP